LKLATILIGLILIGGLAFSFTWNQSVSNNPPVKLVEGDIAPDFELKDQDGKIHKLSEYKGQRVVVYFFPKADTPG